VKKKNCYDFTKWLVESAINGQLQFPEDFSFHVHDGEVSSRNHIKAILNNYLYFNITYPDNNLS